MPDELTDGWLGPLSVERSGGGTPPPLSGGPDRAAVTGGGGRTRRPSWLRALLVSLVIIASGAACGAAAYRLERSLGVQPPTVEQTADGWRITARRQREFSGLALYGDRLVWQNGAAIELLELDTGRLRLLGPGPGMRATWDPAVGERYAVWFEAERRDSPSARAVVYDTHSGRRWTLAEIGSVLSYPALSGDAAVWCSTRAVHSPSINGVWIGDGIAFEVAPGRGEPVIDDGVVVWATDRIGPLVAAELASGTTWPVAAGLTRGRFTGLALAGRTVVWGQTPTAREPGRVAAIDVDGGDTTVLARGAHRLCGPAFDGRTVVWGERGPDGDRIMACRLDGPTFTVAAVAGDLVEVAVSDARVAWIAATAPARYEIVVARLPQ